MDHFSGHMFYIGLYRENMKKMFSYENLDICYVVSPSRPLPQIAPAPGGHMFDIGLHEKNFLSETIKPKSLYLVYSTT